MIRGSLFHKCLSIVMVVALLAGLASPAAAGMSDSYGKDDYAAYVALGNAMTSGAGLDYPEDDAYYVKVAEALAEMGKIDDGSYWAWAEDGYRVEELRYLIDDDYEGDGYTAKIGGLTAKRPLVRDDVAHADYITVNVGTNEFSTYIIEQVTHYLYTMYQNGEGEVKYAYDFEDIAADDMVGAVENIQSIVLEKLYAAAPDMGDKAIELFNVFAEVSTYSLLSYFKNMNGLINAIYELNPDVELYVIGLYNPAEGELLTFNNGEYDYEIPVGTIFGALVELANVYLQVLEPNASSYTYVDPGMPELMIDQMGKTELSDEERIPEGLLNELYLWVEDAAINKVVSRFDGQFTEEEAIVFLEDLMDYENEADRNDYIMTTIEDKVYEVFVEKIQEYVGDFEDAKGIPTKDEVLQLLKDMENASDEAERNSIAEVFVEDLIGDPELQKQAAAAAIKDKIAGEGNELAKYVSVAGIADLLTKLEECPPDDREAVVDEWVHSLVVDLIEAEYEERGMTVTTYPTIDAFFTAVKDPNNDSDEIIREETRWAAANTAVESEEFALLGRIDVTITADEIVELFEEMDDAEDPDAALDTWLTDKCGTEYLAPMVISALKPVFQSAYTAYDETADKAINAFEEYQKIGEEASQEIIAQFEDHLDPDTGKLDLSQYIDEALQEEAQNAVMSGYDSYCIVKDSADAFSGKIQGVLEGILSLAEVESVDLNDLLDSAEEVARDLLGEDQVTNEEYVSQVLDELLTSGVDSLNEGERTVAYLALRYFLATGIVLMPTADGHQTIADNIVQAMETGEDVFGYWGNIALDLYHCAKAYMSKDTQESGQVGTLINPTIYAALGDNITSGTAIAGSDTYVDLLGNALAMDYLCGDETHVVVEDGDLVLNAAINGMRAEELYALVNNDGYTGDAYTADSFPKLAELREEYYASIMNAELVTIEVGINNLVTYPLMQTLLAYNGEDTYEMDWAQFIGEARADKLAYGKDAALSLILSVVDLSDNHILEPTTGKSAYDECEYALDVATTVFESMAYGLISYIFNLDAAVEEIAENNTDGTIALIGFYNPLKDTYFQIDEAVTINGKTLDLSQYPVNVSAMGNFMVDIANRYLANYVGDIKGGQNANDEGSRLLNVKINDAPLGIHDSNVSMDLADLNGRATITVKGKEITFPVPVYFDELYHAGSNALHPSAEGHQYICDQILNALDFEIHADVIPVDNSKYYGDEDPELTFVMDDKSSLYDELIVALTREEGEDVDSYDIYVELLENTGYYEVDTETLVNGFKIVARPVTVDVAVEDGVIKTVTVTGGSIANRDAGADLVGLLGLTIVGNTVTANSTNYDVTVNVQNVEAPDYVCENTRTGVKYEIVHLAVLDAQPGDTIRMLTDSDQTQLTGIYDYAADINLINGVTLDLADYTLVVNSLFAAEGNYLTGNTHSREDVGAKLIVPAENFVLSDAPVEDGITRLPVWDSNAGCYYFAKVTILNDNADRVLKVDTEKEELYFQFDINATTYVLNNMFAHDGVTDNRLSVEVYLQWETNLGTAYQSFVLNDEMVGIAAHTKENGAELENDCYFILTNYTELGIDLDTLIISAQIVSDAGAVSQGSTWNVDGRVEETVVEDQSISYDYSYIEFATGDVCENVSTGVRYSLVHEAIFAANPGDIIKMIANSDQTLLTDVCPSAGMVNLNNGVTLDLQGYTLKLDMIVVAEGSYIVAETNSAVDAGGKLIVPAENFVLGDTFENDKGHDCLPVWDAVNGWYIFANNVVLNNTNDRVLKVDTEKEELYFQFDINATTYVLNTMYAQTGVSDNRMAVVVYLQWETDLGTAYQSFVLSDDMVGTAAHTKENGAELENDCYFILTNYTELGIKLDTLRISARIVSDSGALADGNVFAASN